VRRARVIHATRTRLYTGHAPPANRVATTRGRGSTVPGVGERGEPAWWTVMSTCYVTNDDISYARIRKDARGFAQGNFFSRCGLRATCFFTYLYLNNS
jgi:hypothetical protein